MSAIGNYYVHYKAENYMRQGLQNLKGKQQGIRPTAGDLQLNFKQTKNIGKTSIEGISVSQRQKQLKFLQDTYKEMLFGKSQVAKDFREQAQKALNNLLKNSFKNGAGQVSTNNLLVANIDKNGTAQAQFIVDQIDKETGLTRGQFNKLIREMRTWLDIIQKQQSSMQSLQEKMQFATNNAQKTLSSLRGQLTTLQNQVLSIMGSSYGAQSALKLARNGQTSISLINNYLNKLKQVEVPTINTQSNQQGIIGESFGSWIRNFLIAKSKGAAKDLVKELEKTANSANQGSSGDYYVKFINEGQLANYSDSQASQQLNKKVEGKYFKIKYVYHTSKTDANAIIQYDTGPYKDMPIQEKLSIKNYQQTNSLSVVTGTPLDDVLQFGKNPAWAAHWTNVMIPHPDESVLDGSLITNARKSFNEVALYLGLLGYSEKNKPTVFLVFNSSTQEVKVFDPILLMNELLESKNFSVISTYGKANADFSNEGKLFNNWSDTVNLRMNNIINSLHANKIHVKVNLSSY